MWPPPARSHGAGPDGGDTDGTGALDVELGSVHQQHHGVCDGVLVDRDDVVDPSLDERPGQHAGMLDGDPVGERHDRPGRRGVAGKWAAGGCLHADDPDFGHQRLDGDGHATGETAAADRDDDATEIVEILDDLEAERALPGDDRRVVVWMAEPLAVAVGELLRRGDRFADRRSGLDHRRTVTAARFDLGDRRPGRDEDLARNAEVLGSERKRLGVVSGASRRDAGLGRGPERRNLVHRPTDLERTGALQVLRLEHDGPAEVVGQHDRRDDWCVLGDGAGDAPSCPDVRQRDGLDGVASLHELCTVVAWTQLPQGSG